MYILSILCPVRKCGSEELWSLGASLEYADLGEQLRTLESAPLRERLSFCLFPGSLGKNRQGYTGERESCHSSTKRLVALGVESFLCQIQSRLGFCPGQLLGAQGPDGILGSLPPSCLSQIKNELCVLGFQSNCLFL